MSLIGLLVLMAMPVAADGPEATSVRPSGQCQAVTVTPISRTRPVRSREWSAREVMDLRFETRLTSREETAEVEFRVYTPGGHLYRKVSMDTPPSPDQPDRTGPVRRTPSNRARGAMPVSGTGIVRNGLYGKWTVVPHIVGDRNPCGRSFSFDLVP
jgi:hypothetical protein